MIHKDPNKILFVIVLYKCKLEECHTYQTLLKDIESSEDLFVYDNSPMAQNTDIKVGQYIHNTNNSGLSVAYNRAAAYARENGYNWILLLDQDTTFPQGALYEYRNAIVLYPNMCLIAPQHMILDNTFISPTYYKYKRSEPQKKVLTGIVNFQDACPINSGMLVNVEAFFEAGGYDNNICLDFSDVRFIEKLQTKYHHFFVLPNVICIQNYSGNENNIDLVLGRYIIYLRCARAYAFTGLRNYAELTYTVVKRLYNLTKKTRDVRFLFYFIKEYIF